MPLPDRTVRLDASQMGDGGGEYGVGKDPFDGRVCESDLEESLGHGGAVAAVFVAGKGEVGDFDVAIWGGIPLKGARADEFLGFAVQSQVSFPWGPGIGSFLEMAVLFGEVFNEISDGGAIDCDLVKDQFGAIDEPLDDGRAQRKKR